MKKELILSITGVLILLVNYQTFAQDGKTTKITSPVKIVEIKKRKKIESDKLLDDEASYYSPTRYVIVYNHLFEGLTKPQRRIEILMDEKQFSEKNLALVFGLIQKRFPTPIWLMVNVHTSLATIETPEEYELMKDSQDNRFSKIKFKHKSAFLSRTESGTSITYTTSLLPNYKTKQIVLSDSKEKLVK